MRKFLGLIFALLLASVACSQTYVGELTTNSYTYKNATMVVSEQGGAVTLEMRHVKFAMLMPVKVDVEVKGLTGNKQQGTLSIKGHDIVPLSNGKPHKKYTIYNFTGKMSPTTLTFDCLMGEKKVSFRGKVAK